LNQGQPPAGYLEARVGLTDASRSARVRVDGKFLRAGEAKFWVKGVTYGPFGARTDGLFLPEPDPMAKDLAQIRGFGANTVRVYHPPPRPVLDLLHEHGLKVLVDVPWSKHRCFLDSREDQESGRRAVRAAARAGRGHPAVLAYSVVNEVPPDVARWEGHRKVERFIEELVDIAKQEDPEALATFASYPPIEYLHPRNVDFYTMNVYLHSRDKFHGYLSRLQNLADEKPLVLGEYGIDSIRHGEKEQAILLAMHLEEVFRCGLAGTCVFSYTDEWFTGGHAITDWAFGLVRADRSEKPALAEVAGVYAGDPRPKLARYPRVSVVVCSYNGGRTLDGCLKSLQRVDYPDYEVILVNDGSSDDVPDIAAQYEPWLRVHHQENQGLSAARNVGMDLAEGEIIAYTDDDCFVDEDWLYYLVSKLLETEASGVGGPNFLPEKDGPVAACVSASPGTPAHILLDDTVAEHVPGCNMAFWAHRLRSIKGFDPVYRAAGDDVDVCWRLQDQGDFIVYAPAAMVWHHRRATVEDYLKQQRGYGIAEALLKRKHPDKFRGFRADLSWRGRIYTRAGLGLSVGKPVIHYGLFGRGMFQTIYSPPMVWWPLMVLSLEWWLGILALLGLCLVIHPTVVILKAMPEGRTLVAPLVVGQLQNPLFFLPVLMLLTTMAVAYTVAGQASPPVHQRRFWSRFLIAAMHVAQPVERGWARYRTRFRTIEIPEALHALRREWEGRARALIARERLDLWSESGVGRETLLERLLAFVGEKGWFPRLDPGWAPKDVRFYGDRWCKADLVTVTENHGGERRLTRLRLEMKPTLFRNALLLLLGYLLVLGWAWSKSVLLFLLPVLLGVAWQLGSSRRRLRRTVMATILATAERLGMSVVGAPDAIRRRAQPEAPARSEEPVAAARRAT
jgi:glycosyltransferase involved in cell wall biosynthesis